MYKIKSTKPSPNQALVDLKIGDLAIINEKGDFYGHIFLRAYNGFINLSAPQHTWTGGGIPHFSSISVLKSGDVVTLEVE